MELEGIVQNGVIVPQGECSLPEGTKVTITPSPVKSANQSTLADTLGRLAAKFESLPCDLPTDYSVNHDHYLFGMPKQQP